MERRIAHLDMDAFYASVELLRYPELKGLPVVIGGARRISPNQAEEKHVRLKDYAGRGVATTATYEARALGVRSGMGLMKAAVLAPEAILLPADFDEYRRYSRLFKAAVATIAARIEDRGIDEIYIDLTEVPGESSALAQRIKAAVRAATGLTCSIGITPNKLLAKIASELSKPDGLTLIGPADIAARIWSLPASKINGVGPKASAKLERMGLRTIGDIARTPREILIEHFGQHYGSWLAEAAQGRDDRPVVTEQAPKSISRETTFERDLDPRRDRDQLARILLSLCARVASDLERKGYYGKTIGVKLRYADFRTVTRDTTLEQATRAAEDIRAAARACLKRVALDRKLRLLGVRVGSLTQSENADARAAPRAASAGDNNLRLFE